MTAGRTYFDYNAGAPLRPEAREAVLNGLDVGGNASAVHAEGRAARRIVEAARAELALLTGGEAKRVVFTSGGSESNATVLTPDLLVAGRPWRADRLLVAAVEHPSVLAGGRFSPRAVETVPVTGEGFVDLDALEARLRRAAADGEKVMVSVMLANNETGAIQPVAGMAALARQFGFVSHTDAAQAAGRIPIDIVALDVDFLTLSSHKLGGPQGAGAIVSRSDDFAFRPLVTGGRQERGARAGTENVPAIAGFAAAAAAARRDLALAPLRWLSWRKRIEDLAAAVGPVTVFSANVDRLPQTVCLAPDGVSAETLVIGLDLEGIAVSSGAACSSGKVGPSHVMAAMGVPASLARGAVRVSFGWETTENDLDMLEGAWRRVVGRIHTAGNERAA